MFMRVPLQRMSIPLLQACVETRVIVTVEFLELVVFILGIFVEELPEHMGHPDNLSGIFNAFESYLARIGEIDGSPV